MKKSLVMATLVAVSAGTAGVGALDNRDLKGSDTLFTITNSILAQCPGADPPPVGTPPGLFYIGTGSGAGETTMLNTSTVADPTTCTTDNPAGGQLDCQTTSPMSRFLAGTNPGVCSVTTTTNCTSNANCPAGETCVPGPATGSNATATCNFPLVQANEANKNASAAEGIAFALDGLSILASGIYQNTCNDDPGVAGSDPADCQKATAPNAGLAFDKTIAVGDANGNGNVECRSCTGGNYVIGGPNGWRDVIRLIYTGLEQTTAATPASAVNSIPNRDCNGDLRRTLINNWSHLFENDCAQIGSACCTGALRHAFRRDDESGTTDAFLAILGLPSLNIQNEVSPFCNASQAGDEVAGNVDVPWAGQNNNCPSLPAGLPASLTANQFPGCFPGPRPRGVAPATQGPLGRAGWMTSANALTGAGIASPGTAARPFYTDFQDNDPARTACCGTDDIGQNVAAHPVEQVCRARATVQCSSLPAGHCGPGPFGPAAGSVGTLGVVLPINPPPDITIAPDPYPLPYCAPGRFRLGPAPATAVATNDPDFGSLSGALNDRCPNGDKPLAMDLFNPNQARCFVPVTLTDSPKCINGRNNLPTLTSLTSAAAAPPVRVDAFGACAPGFPCGDGRVYNLHLYNAVLPATPAYQLAPRATQPASSVQVVGAYYRIHTTRTLLTPPTCAGGVCCTEPSATRQLGCLVQASPCSLAYAGREGTDVVLNSDAAGIESAISLKVDAREPTNQCVQNLLSPPSEFYPISRELFFNSMAGFENTGAGTTQELELARCFSGGGTLVGGLPTLIGIINNVNFIPRPGSGAPGCKDFDQTIAAPAGCGQPGPNTDACTNNGPLGLPNDDPAVP